MFGFDYDFLFRDGGGRQLVDPTCWGAAVERKTNKLCTILHHLKQLRTTSNNLEQLGKKSNDTDSSRRIKPAIVCRAIEI